MLMVPPPGLNIPVSGRIDRWLSAWLREAAESGEGRGETVSDCQPGQNYANRNVPNPSLQSVQPVNEREWGGHFFYILEKRNCIFSSSPPPWTSSDGNDWKFLWSQLDWNDLMKFFEYFSPGRLFWNKKWLEFQQPQLHRSQWISLWENISVPLRERLVGSGSMLFLVRHWGTFLTFHTAIDLVRETLYWIFNI